MSELQLPAFAACCCCCVFQQQLLLREQRCLQLQQRQQQPQHLSGRLRVESRVVNKSSSGHSFSPLRNAHIPSFEMATSKGTNLYNRQNWEDAEFPILCQTCLGDNPYLRMVKERFGKECKICTRPFTIFRWCPGARMRFKKTEVCQTCAKLKNVCQTCLLDLEYGLPIQVRDEVLKVKDDLPKSDVNREYYLQQVDKELSGTDGTTPGGVLGKIPTHKHEILQKLARTQPYYKRNRPHICSFWVKGECKRGEECPYRHERPSDPDDPLSDQNIKDRYYGVNDPVADKIMKRASTLPALENPEDPHITTLYVGGMDETFTEADIRDQFYQYGEIRQITMVSKQGCAFVQYTRRSAAENAAEKTFNKLIIKGRRLTIRWGKSQGKQGNMLEGSGASVVPVPGLPGPLPPPPEELQSNFFNLPAATSTSGFPGFGFPSAAAGGSRSGIPAALMPHAIHYPSQDPARMGSTHPH